MNLSGRWSLLRGWEERVPWLWAGIVETLSRLTEEEIIVLVELLEAVDREGESIDACLVRCVGCADCPYKRANQIRARRWREIEGVADEARVIG